MSKDSVKEVHRILLNRRKRVYSCLGLTLRNVDLNSEDIKEKSELVTENSENEGKKAYIGLAIMSFGAASA